MSVEENNFEAPVSPGAQPEETTPKQGRRLAPGSGGKWKLPVLIAGIVIAVLLAAYLG